MSSLPSPPRSAHPVISLGRQQISTPTPSPPHSLSSHAINKRDMIDNRHLSCCRSHSTPLEKPPQPPAPLPVPTHSSLFMASLLGYQQRPQTPIITLLLLAVSVCSVTLVVQYKEFRMTGPHRRHHRTRLWRAGPKTSTSPNLQKLVNNIAEC